MRGEVPVERADLRGVVETKQRVEAGVSPEVAFLECVGELKLIAELIEQRGIAGMREAISNTAELGAVLGGPRVVDGDVRRKMRQVLEEVRSGRFAKALQQEADAGYPLLETARANARIKAIEQVFSKLKKLS